MCTRCRCLSERAIQCVGNTRASEDAMKKKKKYLIESKGNVVTVSSVAGLRSVYKTNHFKSSQFFIHIFFSLKFPGVLSYCVSKAAVDQLTRCSALDLASKGVRVNAVNPGVIITDIHKRDGTCIYLFDTKRKIQARLLIKHLFEY